MDFSLSEEQQTFRDSVRRWVDAEAPKSWARELERREEEYPFELWNKFSEAGFHGIGIEEHEDPYVVEGNATVLVPGHAFSVEPGIYLAGRYGARIEDIVVATDAGPRALNLVSHDLTVVA